MLIPRHGQALYASIVINNLFNVAQLQVIDPNVQAALGSQLDGILDTDNVIDADYTDDMGNNEGDS